MTHFIVSAMATLGLISSVYAEKAAPPAPQGVLVQVDSKGNKQVFRADGVRKVTNERQALELIKTAAVSSQKLNIKDATKDEWDEDGSQESWYYYGGGGGGYPGGGYGGGYPGGGYGGGYPGGGYGGYPYYGCNWYGSYYNYYPYSYYPSYYYGGYNYYYYATVPYPYYPRYY